MKENAIIIDGKRYDFIKAEGMGNEQACGQCELTKECHPCGVSASGRPLCRIYGGVGYFCHTKDMEELNLLLKGKVLYRNGRKVGEVTAIYRDYWWRLNDPFIYYLTIGSSRHSFTYSEVEKLLHREKVVFDVGDLLGSKNVYELKCEKGE